MHRCFCWTYFLLHGVSGATREWYGLDVVRHFIREMHNFKPYPKDSFRRKPIPEDNPFGQASVTAVQQNMRRAARERNEAIAELERAGQRSEELTPKEARLGMELMTILNILVDMSDTQIQATPTEMKELSILETSIVARYCPVSISYLQPVKEWYAPSEWKRSSFDWYRMTLTRCESNAGSRDISISIAVRRAHEDVAGISDDFKQILIGAGSSAKNDIYSSYTAPLKSFGLQDFKVLTIPRSPDSHRGINPQIALPVELIDRLGFFRYALSPTPAYIIAAFHSAVYASEEARAEAMHAKEIFSSVHPAVSRSASKWVPTPGIKENTEGVIVANTKVALELAGLIFNANIDTLTKVLSVMGARAIAYDFNNLMDQSMERSISLLIRGMALGVPQIVFVDVKSPDEERLRILLANALASLTASGNRILETLDKANKNVFGGKGSQKQMDSYNFAVRTAMPIFGVARYRMPEILRLGKANHVQAFCTEASEALQRTIPTALYTQMLLVMPMRNSPCKLPTITTTSAEFTKAFSLTQEVQREAAGTLELQRFPWTTCKTEGVTCEVPQEWGIGETMCQFESFPAEGTLGYWTKGGLPHHSFEIAKATKAFIQSWKSGNPVFLSPRAVLLEQKVLPKLGGTGEKFTSAKGCDVDPFF